MKMASFRLPDHVLMKLKVLAKKYGMSQSRVIQMLVEKEEK